jgi:hypothetical protein
MRRAFKKFMTLLLATFLPGRSVACRRDMEKPVKEMLDAARAWALPEGTPPPARVRLRQSGELRLGPREPWRRFEAEQSLDARSLAFHWEGRLRGPWGMPMRVRDGFAGRAGFLGVKAFGALPVAALSGPALDKAQRQRALAELPWRPWLFSPASGLQWSGAGSLLRASVPGEPGAVEFALDGRGRVLAARAPDRPRLVGKAFVETPWSGTFEEYERFGAVLVPARAAVTWHLPEGDFECFRAAVTEYAAG